MNWNPYLLFDGNCREAMTFYAKLFGADVTYMLAHSDTPAGPHVPPEMQDKIIHACIQLGDFQLMASDAPPAQYEKPQGFSVQISPTSAAETERLYKALVDGGKASMELQETFWAEKFAALVDRYGIPWMINYERRM